MVKAGAARKAATVVANKIAKNAGITVAHHALYTPVNRITITRVSISTASQMYGLNKYF